MANDDERIALFLDYENLAIGARDGLGVSSFDFGPGHCCIEATSVFARQQAGRHDPPDPLENLNKPDI